ncbi:LysR family transcriptional regulator [Sorangium cellulosum So0157-2]|uniref:LysR family transcriptional regulator n=1 Tax=Sorangium cellulosum So0157-2 TaxID=1254432 RepID=S4XJU8_SORCE|nr:LysR family transcriptional regulator [Sorangium cellulosum So0157-2]
MDLGSITAAARTLGETKGSVSRRITRLEHALGVELLRRSPRRVQATEDGLAYRMRVGRALELLEDANAAVQQARAKPSGHLRVTAPFDLGLSLLAPLSAGFAARYPEISVEMLLTEALLDFDAHQIDVALRATASLPDSSLIAYRLQHIEMGLFAAPAYLRKHGPVRRPEDLAGHRLLLAQTTRGHATIALQARDGGDRAELRVRAAIAASDYSFCREVALVGAGIALVPAVNVRSDLDAKRLVPVLKDHAIDGAAPLYLVHPGTRFLPSKIRAFRDYLLDAFGVQGRREASAAR